MADPDDQPWQPEDWGLVFPFVMCRSQGGPYDDDSFVAGYQAGRLDHALAAVAAVGGDRATVVVRTDLLPQLVLIAVHHGFTDIAVAEVEADPDGNWPAMPEWSTATFTRGRSL